MAAATISTVATQLWKLVAQEAEYLWGVEEKVKELHGELQWMQGFLKEADKRQADDERVRQWVMEIREIAYDVEDVVDTFWLQIASKRKEGCANSTKRCACILKEACLLHKIKSQMEEVIKRINTTTRRLETYGIKQLREGDGSSSRQQEQVQPRPFLHLIRDDVVGLEDKIQELVSALVNEERDFQAISICGMGGIGKTTLAKKVYNDPRVRGHFDEFVWAYISQPCDRKNVWARILSHLDPTFDMKDMFLKQVDLEEIATRLHGLLREKKCLVVLDDVWNTQDLENLRPGFPAEGTQSKYILTSRNKEVASRIHRRVYLYELQCLNDEESWVLFQMVAFCRRKLEDLKLEPRMEKLGKQIVQRCRGLPLAIISIAGTFSTKSDTYVEWKEVLDNVKSYMRKGEAYTISDALALSYNNLPPHLKPCFLYFALFPEDYEIRVEKLIHMWVAEGLIMVEDAREEAKEEVAESYLIELLNRCMIQVGKRGANMKIKTCRMHDLVRDLCLSKARQENFLFVFDLDMGTSSLVSAAPRLAINSCNVIQQIKHPHLRSLIFFSALIFRDLEDIPDRSSLKRFVNYGKKHEENILIRFFISVIGIFLACYMFDKLMSYIFYNFKKLRVLDLEGGGPLVGCNLLKKVNNLIHLRYLCLREAAFSFKLSSSLEEMRFLQTLDLRFSSGLAVKVPNVIWRMEQLRHLYLPKICHFKTKLRLGNLKHLQTLVNFPINSCDVRELAKLTNLKKLTMRGFRELKDKSMRCLRNFFDCCCGFDCYAEECDYCLGIEQDAITLLGGLPKLSSLTLKDGAFAGNEIVFSAIGFPQLESLTLNCLPELKKLTVEQRAMPSLCHLKIKECPKMETLPAILSSHSSLQKVDIEGMPQGFSHSLAPGTTH